LSALERIGQLGLVPVVAIDDLGAVAGLRDAVIEGGLPCVEVTFRTSEALQAIELLAADRDLIVGAGTVLDCAQVDQAVDAGAQFIVAPGFDSDVVSHCREVGLAVIPGVATATEATLALRHGLDTVKLFPAEAIGGLQLISALAAPFPSLRFVPTGGIGPAELPGYAGHPSVHAVGGSWIAPPDLLRERRFTEIAHRAAEAVKVVAAARGAGRPSL
jgi:2-dehydro-3-deoxyphosphogluconate aldolase / (4S)-4-hydroxy-2-oxoglutarate aldolase